MKKKGGGLLTKSFTLYQTQILFIMNLFYNTTRFFISFCLLFGFALGQAQDQITLPYSESFENGLGDFNQSTTDDFNWKRNSGGTFSSATGPNEVADGTHYIYTDSPGASGQTANLLLDPFEINSAITNAEVKFQYHMNRSGGASESQFGSIVLDIKESDDTWTTLWSRGGSQDSHWLTAKVDISNYLGSPIHLRLRRIRGAWANSDAAIDDFQVLVSPPVITLLGDVGYFSQFGEPIESGSSVGRPGNHTGSHKTGTDVTGFSEPDGVDCSDLVTYARALELVEAAGARLPTLQELQADVTAGTGCNYNTELIWTQSPGTNSGERWIDTGSFAHTAPESRSETATAYVRYVYDNAPLTGFVFVSVGDVYTDAGATAVSSTGEDLTSSIVVGGDTVNTSIAGTYIVTYNVSDVAGGGGDAEEVTKTVIVEDTASLEKLTSMGVIVYPNPVTTQLRLVYPSATQADYTIYDLMGKQLVSHRQNGQHHQLNVSSLEKGVYLLASKHGNQRGVFRFVKE